jgi:hypothetical protein
MPGARYSLSVRPLCHATHSLVIGRIQPQHTLKNILGFLEPAQSPKAQPKSIQAAEEWPVVDPPPRKQTIEAFAEQAIGLLKIWLQWKLRQRYSLFHRRHALLMNDLEPFLPAQMLHVKLANNACRQRQHNHTVTDCVVHFSHLTLRTGCDGVRLQRVKLKFWFDQPWGWDLSSTSFGPIISRPPRAS